MMIMEYIKYIFQSSIIYIIFKKKIESKTIISVVLIKNRHIPQVLR